ncbi:hypothetical protein SFRURICE_020058 [Spodoptera frugiperda]|nr:hypothetical protein SFRURICE_020058 [Spodoptera frugiperda]
MVFESAWLARWLDDDNRGGSPPAPTAAGDIALLRTPYPLGIRNKYDGSTLQSNLHHIGPHDPALLRDLFLPRTRKRLTDYGLNAKISSLSFATYRTRPATLTKIVCHPSPTDARVAPGESLIQNGRGIEEDKEAFIHIECNTAIHLNDLCIQWLLDFIPTRYYPCVRRIAFRKRLKESPDHRWGPVGLMPDPELWTT